LTFETGPAWQPAAKGAYSAGVSFIRESIYRWRSIADCGGVNLDGNHRPEFLPP